MSQEPVLFARSIRRNIAYGLELADEDEAAARPLDSATASDTHADELTRTDADADSARAPLIVRSHDPESAAGEAASFGRHALSTRVGMADVREAALAANAHAFIGEMKDGYDTFVGERGATISGRRFSILRRSSS